MGLGSRRRRTMRKGRGEEPVSWREDQTGEDQDEDEEDEEDEEEEV